MFLLALSAAAILVGAGGFSIALPGRGAPFRLLAFGLLAWAASVGTTGIAGTLFTNLVPSTLTLLALAWGVTGVLVASARGAVIDAPARLAGGAAAVWRVAGWPPVAAALVFVGLSLAWRTFLAVRLPVVDILGWQYHLVLADVWVQSEAIVRVPQNIWTDGWPATGELLTAWLMTFTHSDALAGFTGLLPLPIAIVASCGLARELGASRPTAALAGLLLGMTPAWLALAGTSYPDPGFAAAVVAAWWLGLRVVSGDLRPSTSLLFGLAAGLAIGAKGSALVLIGPIVAAAGVVILARVVRRAGRGEIPWGPIGAGLAVLLPMVLFGLSWYIRNAVIHGNPLYPVGFGPFPGLASGEYGAPPVPAPLEDLTGFARVVRSWIHDWGLRGYLYNVRPGGFGHAWPAGVALAAVGSAILVRRRRYAPLVLVILPVAVGIALLHSPWYARYTLFLPAIGWALAALVLDRIAAVPRTLIGLALVGVAGISVVLATVMPNVHLDLPRATGARSVAYLSLVINGSPQERATIGLRSACAPLDVIPDGERVAVTGSYFVPHAVAGPGLERTLVQPPPKNIHSIDRLISYLRDVDARWLVTRGRTYLDELADQHPHLLERKGQGCHNARVWVVRGE